VGVVVLVVGWGGGFGLFFVFFVRCVGSHFQNWVGVGRKNF